MGRRGAARGGKGWAGCSSQQSARLASPGAVTERVASNSSGLLPPSSGGKKPKVQVSAGLLLPLKVLGRCPSRPLTVPSASRHSLACGHIPPASASCLLGFLPVCVSLCPKSLFPLLSQMPVMDFKTPQIWDDLILRFSTSHICSVPVSKPGLLR